MTNETTVVSEPKLKPLKYYAAVTRAIREEMRRDDSVVLLGEDVGAAGGIFAQTRGLFEEFGPLRVRDTPIAEAGFTTLAVGAAMTGLRPVVEIGFEDFLTACMDSIVNQGAKLRYMLGGQVDIPVTLYTFGSGGVNAGPQHSQSLAAWFAHVPGLKVVQPASARDVLGLMKTAIRDNNFTLVLLSKLLIGSTEPAPGEDEDFIVPFGQANVLREGSDATLVAIGATVPAALAAAKTLAEEGVAVDLIDPRTVSPLDINSILASVRKTGRLVVAHEAHAPCGVGSEILARTVEEAMNSLKAPPRRVTPPFTPSPFTPNLEKMYRPDADRIANAVRSVMR